MRLDPPDRSALAERVAAVRAVIYLIFATGHTSTGGETLVRGHLCDEAIWPAELLCRLVPDDPENHGLAALLLLTDARRATRLDPDGALVVLEKQDRSRWDGEETARGLEHLARAHRMGRTGSFQLQGAIAALHATASTPEETDWPAILAVYDALVALDGSPVVRLNRLVALSRAGYPDQALAELDELVEEGRLEAYTCLHCVKGELLALDGRDAEAVASLERALRLTGNPVEVAHVRRRIAEISSSG